MQFYKRLLSLSLRTLSFLAVCFSATPPNHMVTTTAIIVTKTAYNNIECITLIGQVPAILSVLETKSLL
jgi:hypothetical protein